MEVAIRFLPTRTTALANWRLLWIVGILVDFAGGQLYLKHPPPQTDRKSACEKAPKGIKSHKFVVTSRTEFHLYDETFIHR